MACTRYRFISCIGDDQEKYYEQKYLLTVPLNPQSRVVLESPESWVELCAREGSTTIFFPYESSMKFKIFHEKTHERHSWKFTFP